jgi:hypothetical protein
LLDHTELGVAFEMLLDALDEDELTVSSERLSRLSNALDRMGESSFDTRTLDALKRLRARSGR